MLLRINDIVSIKFCSTFGWVVIQLFVLIDKVQQHSFSYPFVYFCDICGRCNYIGWLDGFVVREIVMQVWYVNVKSNSNNNNNNTLGYYLFIYILSYKLMSTFCDVMLQSEAFHIDWLR